MRIEPIKPNEPTFKMKMVKTGVSSPLQWTYKSKIVGDETFSYLNYKRNGLELNVCEIKKPDGSSVRAKSLEVFKNLVSAKVQELINGKLVKQKNL